MTRVTAKFVFELPFHINIQRKRTNRPQLLKTKTEEILIYPPALNSPYFSKKSPWSPDPQHLVGKVNNRLIWKAKYIIIDIIRDFPIIPITAAQEKALLTTARETLYKVLTLYRWRGKQLQISTTNIEQIDYRVRYFDATGNPMFWGPEGAHARGEVHLTVRLVAPRNKEWKVICQDLASGTMPEPYESLLLDARNIVSEEPRRAVLDTATACEVFIENFCQNTSKNNPAIEPIIYQALTERAGVLDYFHEVLKYLFRHSLKEDKETLYNEIDYLVRTNNSVKHEGKCQYKNDKGVVIPVDSARARKFISAVEEAIKYTKSLTPSSVTASSSDSARASYTSSRERRQQLRNRTPATR